MWGKLKVPPVLMGAVGVILKTLKRQLIRKEIGIPNRIRILQTSALLGIATILKSPNEVQGLTTGPGNITDKDKDILLRQ